MAQKYEGGVGGSVSQWTYGKPATTKSGYPLLTSSDLGWLKQFPEFGGPTETGGQRGPWSNATYTKDAISRRLGDTSMKTDNWGNAATPAQQGNIDVGGGFTPSPAPTAPAAPPPRQWRPIEPIRGNIPNPIQAPSAGTPIVDIAPAPAPQTTTPTQQRVGGPSGFTEQYDVPTTPMPSVDQLYKTYTDIAGENQGMRDYLASPQFQAILQSGNIPLWMISDPIWRSLLVKTGRLNWDAINKRLSQ